MRKSKTALLLVFMLCLSVTMTGCAGSLGTIFSGLLDGVMSSFGNLFTMQGFTGFLGNVMGQVAPMVGQQVASGNSVEGQDIWQPALQVGARGMGNMATNGAKRYWNSDGKKQARSIFKKNDEARTDGRQATASDMNSMPARTPGDTGVVSTQEQVDDGIPSN